MQRFEQWCSEHRLALSPKTEELLGSWYRRTESYGMESVLFPQLGAILSQFPGLEEGVEKLLRFLDNTRSPRFFLSFLERDPDALPVLIRMLAIRSSSTECLIQDPDSFDWLRLHAGKSTSAEHLRDILVNELRGLEEERDWLPSMRTFRQRETLRVLVGFVLQGVSSGETMNQLAQIADAAVHGCLTVVEMSIQNRRRSIPSLLSQFSFLAVGDYGSGLIDFIQPLEMQVLVNRSASLSPSPSHANDEELSRLLARWSYWMTHPNGLAYSIDTTGLLPIPSPGASSPLFDPRTWIHEIERDGLAINRLPLISTRLVAGDPWTASQAVEEASSFVFQRFASDADEAELLAVSRHNRRRPKQSYGIEPNTAPSARLLQLWREWNELRFQVAWQPLLGETKEGATGPLGETDRDAQEGVESKMESLRRDLLLTQIEEIDFPVFRLASTSTPPSESSSLPEGVEWVHTSEWDEVDLILDPKPSVEWSCQVLSKYGFRHRTAAMQHLHELAREDIRLLSTKRCRFALSNIAKSLLEKIHRTPDPDLTLENLCATTRSIGGKGVLWELFLFHEASMELYLRLCGASPYLVSILLQHPGMIDELLDSLMLSKLPTATQLKAVVLEMCRGAEDIHSILVSFKNAMHLNVGVRDLLGKDENHATHRALSAIADACVERLIQSTLESQVRKLGAPRLPNGEDCGFTFLTLGKYGAQEPNYHSDLSLLCFYEAEGTVVPTGNSSSQRPISHFDFFNQLAQKVNQQLNRLGPTGRLYESHVFNLSLSERSPMAWSLSSFVDHIERHSIAAFQRLRLVQARSLGSHDSFGAEVIATIRGLLADGSWSDTDRRVLGEERRRLEETASPRNLKRGYGGTLDVEWLAQSLWIQHLASHSFEKQLAPSTFEIMAQLAASGVLMPEEAARLSESYQFLRRIETGLRLMNLSARHDLPTHQDELNRLAYVLRMEDGGNIEALCAEHRERIREQFLKHCSNVL
ncbi:hypothetical protein [Pirellula sp. SH-Sr6A]|uniref:[protein-PII] uridylyltransferase family protein n=1 Tax=Pirellula sp. SH-Sr6A TaxID=1632865 RepID=UPI00143A1260|nr:hypothetical protein [Pirellula sp. SH-Sr6A]